MTNTHSERILILDFGSQVTQLIARRVRESGVYCEIHPFQTVTANSIQSFAPRGVILSGGPASVHKIETPRAPKALFDGSFGLPILGICYGEQTMVHQMGGTVTPSEKHEFGRALIEITDECMLFEGTWLPGETHEVWMSHGDRVDTLPSGFRTIAVTENAPYAAIANDEKRFYALQFHPEVVHTPDGAKLLRNFTHLICDCSGTFSLVEGVGFEPTKPFRAPDLQSGGINHSPTPPDNNASDSNTD